MWLDSDFAQPNLLCKKLKQFRLFSHFIPIDQRFSEKQEKKSFLDYKGEQKSWSKNWNKIKTEGEF